MTNLYKGIHKVRANRSGNRTRLDDHQVGLAATEDVKANAFTVEQSVNPFQLTTTTQSSFNNLR